MPTFITELPVHDLPGNEHYTEPGDPTVVTRARYLRLSWIGKIDASDPRFDELADAIPEKVRPAGTFGAAGLESQETAMLWFGPAGVIASALNTPGSDPIAALFQQFPKHGKFAAGWPETQPWPQLIRARTWHPGGSGIVATYSFADDPTPQVVVYEISGNPAMLSRYGPGDRPGPMPIVTWHCARCHMEGDCHERWESGDPSNRQAACRAARAHLQPGRCKPREAHMDDAVATIQNVVSGTPRPADIRGLHARSCATRPVIPGRILAASSCAEVLQARAAMPTAPTRLGG